MATNTLVPSGGTVSFAGLNYNCQVIECRIREVAPRRDEVETMCGISTSYGQPRWEMYLRFVQDWGSGGTLGLSAYLWDNAGQNKSFVYHPTDNATPGMTGTVTIRAASMGDQAGAIARDEVTMDCVGKPTRS